MEVRNWGGFPLNHHLGDFDGKRMGSHRCLGSALELGIGPRFCSVHPRIASFSCDSILRTDDIYLKRRGRRTRRCDPLTPKRLETDGELLDLKKAMMVALDSAYMQLSGAFFGTGSTWHPVPVGFGLLLSGGSLGFSGES